MVPSALKVPNSGYFHKIFGMQLQKVLVYLYTKKFFAAALTFLQLQPYPLMDK